MTDYKADAIAAPSLRGFDGVTGSAGSLVKGNLSATSANITLSNAWLGKWITICANGAKMYVVAGKLGDTVTATVTEPPFADGEKCQFIVTTNTQLIAVIGASAVTNGLTYWGSQTQDKA